MTGNW